VDTGVLPAARLQIGVLGRLRVTRDGAEVELGTRKQRVLLAGLALTPNRVVPTSALVEMIWRSDPPPAVAASLHGYVAALRRVLEPDRPARTRPEMLLTRTNGYELQVPAESVDASAFTRAVETASRRASGADAFSVPLDRPTTDLAQIASQLETALTLWRGTPYPELEDAPEATAERARLDELRLVALQDRARVHLALGRHVAVVADLGPLTQTYPLREDLWSLLALALARCGRQADALEALRTARAALDEELGIDPGPTLQRLEVAILRQDSALLGRPPPVRGSSAEPPPPDLAQAAGPGTPPVRRASPVNARELPLVGRDREIEALEDLAAQANAGVPRVALVVGEPGIGKTRLTQEIAARAADRGFIVLRGRCSQDEGAPPMWPWLGVLRELQDALPDETLPDLDGLVEAESGSSPSFAADRFRTFDQVTRALVRAAMDHPLLVIFDDLHWADASSLRLLQHLVDALDQGRLLIVAARRSHPEPQDALADLGEALARRGVLRLDLAGLASSDVMALATAATGTAPDTGQAMSLRQRTDGNPFFIVEVLKLYGHDPERLEQGAVPAAVGDVIAARVGQLPPRTQHLLRLAAVVGREADLDLLAQLEGTGEEEVLDGLEPAMSAGALLDPAGDRLHFNHALVRDAIYAAVPLLRRQHRHAEVARLLEHGDASHRRLTEIARHWLLAGPGHAAQAWRMAVDAAAYATRLQAHEDAADLLGAALRSQVQDPAATPTQRYDVLMARALACRGAADSDGQRAATAEAIELAGEAEDVQRLAVAASTSSEGALWSNRPQGEVDTATVHALQRVVRELPGADTPLRCRAFLALSREMYWAPQPEERKAYAELGLAMARRLNDPQMQAWACHTAIVAMIRPATLELRTRLAEEAVNCSRAAADEEGAATGLFWRAIMAGEAGRLGDRRQAVHDALELAERHRLRYLQVMLGTYEVPWLALEGRFAEAEQLYEATERWTSHASFPFRDEALAGARLCLDLWQGRAGDLLPMLSAIDEVSSVDLGNVILLLLLRTGQLTQAAAQLDRHPPPLVDDTFDAPLCLAVAAEAGFLLRRRDLAATAYALLTPWAGRAVSAGTGSPLGPVDSFLALAAAAVGESRLAAQHADRALDICGDWDMPPVAEWLGRHRAHGRF
jgi:DNA-binding SARP family transcriptional activator